MTEPNVLNAMHDDEEDLSTSSGDQTQPTAEILNVLNQLNVKTEPLENAVPPPTEYEALTADLIKDNPHNPEGWRRLIELAEQSGDILKIRSAYDALLVQYPNTVCFYSLPHPSGGLSDVFLLVFGSNCVHKSFS